MGRRVTKPKQLAGSADVGGIPRPIALIALIVAIHRSGGRSLVIDRLEYDEACRALGVSQGEGATFAYAQDGTQLTLTVEKP
jgi:hypothetical protein